MSYVPQYEEARNAHYYGRGRVYFTPPLLPTGGVNMGPPRSPASHGALPPEGAHAALGRPGGGVDTAAYGRLWGENWPATPDVPGQLHLPAGRYVGNARGLAITPTLRKLATSAWDERGNTLVESVAASLTLYGHGAANLADALHGARTQHHATAVTEVLRTGSAAIDAGGMLFTRRLVDLGKPITVVPSWTQWQEGVHWQRQPFGLQLLAGISGPYDSYVTVAYTPQGGAQHIDAYADTGLELGIVYTGVNVVDGRPLRVQLYRARPSLEGAFTALDDGIGAIALNFSIEPVRAPGGLTQWLRIERGEYQHG